MGSKANCAVLLVLVAALLGSPAARADVTVIADPEVIESGGTTQLIAPDTVDLGWGPISVSEWFWSHTGYTYDGPGVFSPSAGVQAPTWTAPGNPDLSPRHHQIVVRCKACVEPAICEYAYGYVTVTELAFPDVVTVTPTAEPAVVAPGESTQLRANATDSWGHGLTYQWRDCSAGGEFFPSAEVADPIYTPPPYPGPEPVRLRLEVTCMERLRVGCRGLEIAVRLPWHAFDDLPEDHWAYEHMRACYQAGLFAGYPDNTLRPESLLTRAQMAVLLARLLRLVEPGM